MNKKLFIVLIGLFFAAMGGKVCFAADTAVVAPGKIDDGYKAVLVSTNFAPTDCPLEKECPVPAGDEVLLEIKVLKNGQEDYGRWRTFGIAVKPGKRYLLDYTGGGETTKVTPNNDGTVTIVLSKNGASSLPEFNFRMADSKDPVVILGLLGKGQEDPLFGMVESALRNTPDEDVWKNLGPKQRRQFAFKLARFLSGSKSREETYLIIRKLILQEAKPADAKP